MLHIKLFGVWLADLAARWQLSKTNWVEGGGTDKGCMNKRV